MGGWQIEWGKLGMLGLVIVCMTVLLVSHTIASEAGTGVLTLIVGYLIGNGNLAAKGKPNVPTIGAAVPTTAEPGES